MPLPTWIRAISDDEVKEKALMAYAHYEEAKANSLTDYKGAVATAESDRRRQMLKARAEYDSARKAAKDALDGVRREAKAS